MATKKKLTFEESIGRLQEIVDLLERGDTQLQDSLDLFTEGTKLVSSCTAMLDDAEQQVVKLQKGPDGEPQELPFEEE